jgi:AmmeMemoRadiSam system protein B
MKKNKRILITVLACAIATGLLAGFFIYARRAGESLLTKNRPIAAVFHYSYYSQPQFFDEAYGSAVARPYQPTAKAVLVNHHLLAAKFIAESFGSVATNAPVTVLLISPNHFSAGKGDVITSSGIWKTPYGDLPPDSATVKKISDRNLAEIEEPPFEQEHGISGIVAFVKKSLPNAGLVPLIVRDNLPIGQAREIAQGIFPLLPKNTLIVGSFDFSHYLIGPAADFHDVENLAALENFDFNRIGRLDSDSRPGLAFFLELLKDGGNQNFHLLENTNSAKLTHQDILETTSYIDGYFIPGLPATSSANTILVLPAIAVSPAVAATLDRNNKAWSVEYLERLFFGQDKTVVKIDGDPNLIANQLKRYGVTDIATADATIGIGSHQVKILVKTDLAKARQALDAGASAVLEYGAVADTFSLYNNKPIINLRGDLLSDQVLKNGGISLAFGLAFKPNQLQITLLSIAVKNGIAKLMIGKERDKVLADTAAASNAGQDFKKQITQGLITLKY